MQQYNTQDNFTPVDSDMFTRINNDVNGNPRYVLHFSALITVKDKENHPFNNPTFKTIDALEARYKLAAERARKVGGKKYNTKQHSNMLVFQSYNLDSTCYEINKILEQVTATQLK